jgi:hypothetical protein
MTLRGILVRTKSIHSDTAKCTITHREVYYCAKKVYIPTHLSILRQTAKCTNYYKEGYITT